MIDIVTELISKLSSLINDKAQFDFDQLKKNVEVVVDGKKALVESFYKQYNNSADNANAKDDKVIETNNTLNGLMYKMDPLIKRLRNETDKQRNIEIFKGFFGFAKFLFDVITGKTPDPKDLVPFLSTYYNIKKNLDDFREVMQTIRSLHRTNRNFTAGNHIFGKRFEATIDYKKTLEQVSRFEGMKDDFNNISVTGAKLLDDIDERGWSLWYAASDLQVLLEQICVVGLKLCEEVIMKITLIYRVTQIKI